MPDEDDLDTGCYASPPCFMHELDPAYLGLSKEAGAQDPADAAERRTGCEDAQGMMTPDETMLARLGLSVIRTIPDAVIYADRKGVIRFWNAGAARIFGFSEVEAIGQSLDVIIPERLQRRHWDGYDHMMKTGQARHGPDDLLAVPAVTKSGDALSIQFTVTPVYGDAGELTGIAAVLRDVTATFQELKRLRSRG